MTILWGQIHNLFAWSWPFDGAAMPLIPGLNNVAMDPTSAYEIIMFFGIGLGATVAIALAAMGGYNLMTSGGDAKKIKDAQEQIQNAILGFLLIILSVGVAKLVFSIIGVTGVI